MATTHEPPGKASTEAQPDSHAPASEHAPSSKGGGTSAFTATGPIPPVAPVTAPTPPPTSASDRAFGPGGPAVRDANAARVSMDNPTWDPNAEVMVGGKTKQGGWVEATEARTGADDKRLVAGTKLDPSKVNADLQAGRLDAEGLQAITPQQVAQVSPLGDAPKNILKGSLHQSWHEAKHQLLEPGGNVDARRMLMAKLWEYRQWHHEQILQRTQKEIGKEGLSEWASAGSTTLTSDIDVNLKGNKTEQAVAAFNRQFKADGFDHEAGVVYDVNVYALDFMHKDTFKGLAEAPGGVVERHDFDQDKREGTPSPTRVAAKEGARQGSAGGGVSTHSEMLAGRMVAADADLQRVWSLVKMRLYMTGAQWTQYLTDAEVPASTQAQVNLRYDGYMRELQARMLDGHRLAAEADAQAQTGFAVLDHAARNKAAATPGKDAENVKMAASNRLYEEKLGQMATLRTKVQTQIALRQSWIDSGKREDAEGLDAAIDGNLAILRDLISECAMFSNEAYVTDGAVNHVVVGMQSKIEITQTKGESMDAFNENVADSLKEIARHSATIGEASYKAGKYLWRMADAAKNLGSRDPDIEKLYAAGFKVANEVKGGDAPQSELDAKAGTEMQKILGGDAATPEALMAFVRGLASRVARAHRAELAERGQDRAAPVKTT